MTDAIGVGIGIVIVRSPLPLLAPVVLGRSSSWFTGTVVDGAPVVVVVVHPAEPLHRVLVETDTDVLLPEVMFCVATGTPLTVMLTVPTTGTPFTVELVVLVLVLVEVLLLLVLASFTATGAVVRTELAARSRPAMTTEDESVSLSTARSKPPFAITLAVP